jgi:hypothetical protein
MQWVLGAVLLWVEHPSHETQLHLVLKAKKKGVTPPQSSVQMELCTSKGAYYQIVFNFIRIPSKIGNAYTV